MRTLLSSFPSLKFVGPEKVSMASIPQTCKPLQVSISWLFIFAGLTNIMRLPHEVFCRVLVLINTAGTHDTITCTLGRS